MKKITFALLAVLSTTLAFSQAKIKVANGKKIVAETIISLEASLSPGMDITSNSTTTNALEVKSSTDKNYTISNTLTKIKAAMNMMGQSTNYDSEEKKDPTSDVEKAFAEKLNKPIDVVIDNATGIAAAEQKKEGQKDGDDANPMDGLLSMFADNSDDAVVSGAFELIPQGKKIGDSWADSTISKEMKTTRTYTLKSISGDEATIQLNVVSSATNTVDVQGMQMEFKSNTKSTGEIITDKTTGQVKKKNSQSDITGSFQIMGQDMPINAKVTSTSTYQ